MAAADNQARAGARYLGLSFSGGGYRAAAFSLGTLALLKDLELLGHTAVLSGVSGGSIALGAYLCAKAGSAAEIGENRSDQESWFYDSFYTPFLHYLSTEEMAEGFVHLSWLLQNRKLIKAAADANDRLFSRLLGQPARLGSDRIRALLDNERCSPDYAFFNSADISSLNLFRFGLQKHRPGDGNEGEPAGQDVAIVVGRWILTPGRYRNPTRELYRFSKQLRVADCVAASHAFPVGLEPMVFPNDFFPPGQDGAKANAAFAGSEVCERQQAVGLLDGGLYDNLGLASVEDIRELLNSEHRQSQRPGKTPPFVVIATDVDNIQPSLSFYDASQARPQPVKCWWRHWSWLGYGVIAAGGAWLVIAGNQWLLVAVLVAVIVLAWVGLKCRLRRVVNTALQGLGFTNSFVQQRKASDMKSIRGKLGLVGLVGGWPPLQHLRELGTTLNFNLLVQRGGQPVPMFSGYLKRTRSLTYGYLQTKYRDERQARKPITPHLVRNMIFELTQGAEADPDYASELITLPVEKYSDLNEQQEEVYRETSVMRKMRHAQVAARLIQIDAAADDATQEIGDCCIKRIWHQARLDLEDVSTHQDGAHKEGQNAEIAQSAFDPSSGDAQLDNLAQSLKLDKAALLWNELWEELRVGTGHCERQPCQQSSSPIDQLLTDTRSWLEQALQAPEISEGAVLENCRITPEPVPEHYSWIPLICEMATNLPTTLWLEGFRYYAPNRIVDGRIETPGAWFSRPPKPHELKGRPLLDLRLEQHHPADTGNNAKPAVCPAAAITVLAGYVTTVFNLLEYYYSYVEHSESLVRGLARTVSNRELWEPDGGMPLDTNCQRALLDLPFTLRQAVGHQLNSHWQWIQGKRDQPEHHDRRLEQNLRQLDDAQARLDLLRPWLHSRGPFPASWWIN